MRAVLIVGGAPRIAVDAVRYLSVKATGATAVALRDRLASAGVPADLLLSDGAMPLVQSRRYVDRADLESELQAWIGRHPTGVVVMSAAVNDYRVVAVEMSIGDDARLLPRGAKTPSGADELVIRLRPAEKLIDHLRGWGLTGPIVGFKYEARETVEASARQLQQRCAAALVVANSLCGGFQALVDHDGTEVCANRDDLLDRLARRLADLSQRGVTRG